jgi:hypothetical protein
MPDWIACDVRVDTVMRAMIARMALEMRMDERC